MQKCFVAIREDPPGNAWRERFVTGRAEAEATVPSVASLVRSLDTKHSYDGPSGPLAVIPVWPVLAEIVFPHLRR
jgi:hypothetical protein